jgi:hypothetical protein
MLLTIKRSFRTFLQKFFDRHAASRPSIQVLELDQALTVLCHWGRPKLFRLPSGWYCFVDIGLDAKGTQITVDSNTSHASPTLAALECLARAQTLHPKNLNTDLAI